MKKPGLALVPLTFAALWAATVSAQQLAAEAPASAQINATRPAVAARHGIVAAGHPIAASAGLQILLKGGNAFDAAVAVGAMEAMAEPEMNGIGGNGFMTVFHKETGKVWSLAMTGAAPLALRPAEMTPESLDTGMKAGIVPGNLGGYLAALDRFGTMSLAEVLAPAIEYAEEGYPIDPMLAASIDRGKAKLALYPTTARIFLPGGQPLRAGGVEILNEVVLNQVLVRFTPPTGGDANAFTRAVVARIQNEGVMWASGTKRHGNDALRISVSNWSTTADDIDRSADAILAAIREETER